jgi:hypothetical protein
MRIAHYARQRGIHQEGCLTATESAAAKTRPIVGGVFAIVLFLVFASGLASGALFPTLPPNANV